MTLGTRALAIALYSKLTEVIADDLATLVGVSRVYDAPVPNDAAFPHVSISEGLVEEAGTFTTDETLHFPEIRVWTRYGGQKELNRICDAIFTRLHKAALSASGVSFVDCMFQNRVTFLEEDGKTWQGVMTFKAYIQPN